MTSGYYWNNFDLDGVLNLPGIGEGKTKALSPTRRDSEDEKWDPEEHPFPTSIDGTEGHQDHMFANSWTAPIEIGAIDATDMPSSKFVQTIYIFNAGYEKDGVREVGDGAGQWSSIPIHAAPYTKSHVIPATQAFMVTSIAEDATLTLDYYKHVYKPAMDSLTTHKSIDTDPLRAPRRATMSYDPRILKITVNSGEYTNLDELYVLQRNDFKTDSLDNGWDGNKIMGESFAPQLYAMSDGSKMAVNAVKDMEGMKIGFKAGTSAQDYTLSFDYEEQAEPLYLYDKETNAYTEITNEATYEFTTTDTKAHERFLLTRSNSPQIATGVEEIDTENVH